MNNFAGFSSTVGTVLGVSVVLQGVNAFIAGLQRIYTHFQALPTTMQRVSLAMLGLTIVTLGFIGVAMKMGAEQQRQRILLEAWSGSARQAQLQMQAIENVASRGIFRKEEIFEAVRILDQAQIPLKGNLQLMEQLGMRSGDLVKAAELVRLIEGSRGGVPWLGRRLQAFGITPAMLREHGVAVRGFQVTSPPDRIIQALKEIEKMDPALKRMQESFGAGVGAVVYQVRQILMDIGELAAGPMAFLLRQFAGMLKVLKEINEMTHGAFAWFLVGGAVVHGILTIVSLMKQYQVIMRSVVILTGIWRFMQQDASVILRVIVMAYNWIRAILPMITSWQYIQAMLANATAWALGNWAGALVGLGIIGGLGYATYSALSPSDSEAGLSGPSSDRPYRRDDMDNAYRNAYGRAWTG